MDLGSLQRTIVRDGGLRAERDQRRRSGGALAADPSAYSDGGVNSVTAIALGAVAGLIVVAIAAVFLLRFTIQQERMRRGVRLRNQEDVVSPALQLQPMSSIPTAAPLSSCNVPTTQTSSSQRESPDKHADAVQVVQPPPVYGTTQHQDQHDIASPSEATPGDGSEP